MKDLPKKSHKGVTMSRPRHSLKLFGRLYFKLAEIHGETAAENIFWLMAQTMGGEKVTIPDAVILNREMRDARIREEYDKGIMTRATLAGRFDISIRQVDNILQNQPLFSGEGDRK